MYYNRRITKFQIFIVSVLGFMGGIYIWKPLLEEHAKKQRELALSEANAVSVESS
ncbi:hypothetical protein TSAR_015194 [Trichomalopsis sarcophagae]|uniref:Uncharacterized protein n=1 Tax=Trichomalopsis sarcophagae TaxID=543379 RepID=A0A232EPI5_9HYME|nr:hypothetical protein TSAR_015194 [Trichomalopsis sarcophagae]